MKKTSNLFSLDSTDVAHGVVVAAAGAAVVSVQETITSGSLAINPKQVGLTALAAGLGYLIKKLFTRSKIVTNATNSSTPAK